MRHIERVRSNLKGGCSVELGMRTVIYGPNGSGKSSIVQAIELATTGAVSDMEGREQVKQSTALARLFPANSPIRFAECDLSSGENFRWELPDGARKGTYKKPVHDRPCDVKWPLQVLAAVLGGDATTVQAWLEKQVFKGLTKRKALAKLPPSVRSVAENLMDRKGKTDFLSLAKDAKSEARALRAQATRTESTVESMVEGISPPLDEEERRVLSQKSALEGAYMTEEEHEVEREAIYQMAIALQNFQEAVKSEPGNQMDGKLEMLGKAQAALEMIEQHRSRVGEPTEYCWVCGSSENTKDHEEQVGSAVSMLGDALAYKQRCAESQKKLAEMEQELQAKCAVFNATQIGESPREAALILAKDDAVRKTWRNAEAQKAESAQLRAKADALTSTAKSLLSVGKDLLNAAKSEFESNISSFLPEGDTFEIDLTSARVGLLREDGLHSALSGAEWNRVLLAIACGIANGSTLNVLVPPDRAWDRDTLEQMMIALSKADVQIVVMSTVKPEPVEGWAIVDLTRS